MKALVTGGSGFIGRNIVKRLKELGWEVVGVSAEASDGVIRRDIRGDLSDLMEGVDVVFHEAAVTSPPQFEEDPYAGLDVNVMGTFNVLQTAARKGVKRAVIASSSAVYGLTERPGREDEHPETYPNLYPITKLFGEYLGRYYAERKELEVVSLRYFNVYGPGENSKGAYSSVVSKFLDDALAGRRPVIYGDSTQRRDLVYVEDAVTANLPAAEKGKAGEVYNVGTGEAGKLQRGSAGHSESVGEGDNPCLREKPAQELPALHAG